MPQKINQLKRISHVISFLLPAELLNDKTPKPWDKCPHLTRQVQVVLRAAESNRITVHEIELLNPKKGHYLARMIHAADGQSPSDYVKLEEAFGYRLETITDRSYPGLLVHQMEVPREH